MKALRRGLSWGVCLPLWVQAASFWELFEDPLNLRGPRFLLFYGICFVLITSWTVVKKWTWARKFENNLQTDAVGENPYAVSFLVGGEENFVLTLLHSLMVRHAIELRKVPQQQWRFFYLQPVSTSSDAEQKVLSTLQEVQMQGATLKELTKVLRPWSARLEHLLASTGLRPTVQESAASRNTGMLAYVLLMGVGVVKVFVGLSRGKPVLFLIGALVLTFFCMKAFRKISPVRTEKGQRLFAGLKQKYSRSSLEAVLRNQVPGANGLSLEEADIWGFALYGASFSLLRGMQEISKSSTHQRIKNNLYIHPNTSIFYSQGRGCGSSCGGSCGSSCGGSCGGGCGGGCGGCGGG